MEKALEIRPDDDILSNVKFTIYGYEDKRVAKQFLPELDEPQTKELQAPWGGTMTARSGDYLVSDADSPTDSWPVEREIFEQSYREEKPGTGIFKKFAAVGLVPLTELTGGDPDQLVTVHSLEGALTVRAGDFHLARGVKGEIWPLPNEKVEENLYVMD